MPAGVVGSVWAAGSWSATAWEANTWANAGGGPSLVFVLDLNTRLIVFLCDHYGVSTATSDLTTLMERYMNGLTGTRNQRFFQMVQDATDAMS